MCTVKTEIVNSIIKSEPYTFSWAIHLDLHDRGSALPLVSDRKWILPWKILVVLGCTDMQGDASADQGALPWILIQPLTKKNFVLYFTVAASTLTLKPKGRLSSQDHSRFLAWSSKSCFTAGCIWQLRVVQQRQAVLRHQATWWNALSCTAMELQMVILRSNYMPVWPSSSTRKGRKSHLVTTASLAVAA